jgi:hypothetical protein
MESRGLVVAYCSSGPYKHLTQLLDGDRSAWFPWGYRSQQVSPQAATRLERGAIVEIWEVDDTRQPSSARPMAVAQLDFVLDTGNYLTMTLRCGQGEPIATEEAVLEEVDRGRLAFEVPALQG